MSNLGAGYESMTPKRSTKVFIANNDELFSRQLIEHNKTCSRHEACKKNPQVTE